MRFGLRTPRKVFQAYTELPKTALLLNLLETNNYERVNHSDFAPMSRRICFPSN